MSGAATLDALAAWLAPLYERLDPVLRFERFIDGAADAWQRRALASTAATMALRVCRQAGKSSVLAALAIGAMERGKTVLVLAPAERQAKELARKVVSFLPKTLLVVERSTLTELELSNGGRLICVPASGATIRGYTIDLLLIDEAAFCDEDAVTAVLPMVVDDGRVVFASTTGARSGYFANIFLTPNASGDVDKITVRGTEIPRLAKKVERMRATLAPHKFRAEIEVEFLAEGEGYFDMGAIARAVSAEAPLWA